MTHPPAVVETAALFVGIDWGNARNQLCVLGADGTLVGQRSLSNDGPGIAELRRRLRQHYGIVGIAIERSEGLLVEALQADGHRMFCVSPKLSARARERYRLAPRGCQIVCVRRGSPV